MLWKAQRGYMFKLVNWSENLDLNNFYSEAASRGFVNNSSQKAMIDCFRNEREWAAWILYQDSNAIGSVAAHSFNDVMGANSYRVLARTCILNGNRKSKGLMTAKVAIGQHQNLTNQFLLPKCIEWVAGRGNIYATSNKSREASQQLVHNYYFPTLEKLGIVKYVKEVHYRYTDQTVWQIFPDKFLKNLELYPRWV
jgi:hypothetical protein